jgi:hypothetical protein
MFKSFLTMPVQCTSSKYGSPCDHISRWHLVEHSPSIVHVATLCIHVNQAIHHTHMKDEARQTAVREADPPAIFHNKRNISPFCSAVCGGCLPATGAPLPACLGTGALRFALCPSLSQSLELCVGICKVGLGTK